MTQIHYNTAFDGMKSEDLDKWLEFNRERLIGSAIFTKNESFTSKLVRWGEKHLFAKCKDNHCFVPSHTGSIIEYAGGLYIFDMKPLRASVQPLKDYLLNTDDEFVLVLRDFSLNTQMFSLNLQFHIGDWYPYMSAIRSVFTKRQTKSRRHCSEIYLIELKKQGLFQDVNSEITPDELLHLLTKGDKCH